MPPLEPDATSAPRRHIGRSVLAAAAYLLAWWGLAVASLRFEVAPEVRILYPPSALDVVLLLVLGPRFWPLLALSGFIHAFLVTRRAFDPLALLACDAVTVIVYLRTCALLERLRVNARLLSLRDVAWFTAVAGLGAPLFLAAGHILIFGLSGQIPRGDLGTRVLERWASDALGIGMLAPPLLLLLRRWPALWHDAASWRHGDSADRAEEEEAFELGQHGAHIGSEPEVGWARRWGEALGQAALLGACIWIGYGVAGAWHFDYRHAVFVPLIWIAARHGFGGVATALAFFNVAAALAVHHLIRPSNGLALQLGLLCVTYTGLMLGAFVSERSRIGQRLRHGHQRLALIARATSDSLWEWDLRSGRVWRNCGPTKLFGYHAHEIVPHIDWWDGNIHPEDRERVKESIRQAQESGDATWNDEYRYVRRDGSVAHVLDRAHIVRSPGGRALKMVGAIVDVSEQRQAEARLRHSTTHDALSELPNRLLFLEFLQHALDSLARRGASGGASGDERAGSLAVLLFDLDRFKVINDSLGHRAGDDLLREVARRLRQAVRPGDTAARFGSDQFAILLEGPGEIAEILSVVARVQGSLREPMRLSVADDGHHASRHEPRQVEVSVSASVGIVVARARSYARAEDVLRDANIALHRAKERDGAAYALFDRAMHERALRLLRLETDLRAIVEGPEIGRHLSLRFQPLVRLRDGQVEGFEALLRWQHRELGDISPGEFVPVAEETGLIVPIGAWVLDEACRHLRGWQSLFPRLSLSMSVNLSGRQLAQPGLVGKFAGVLERWNVDARRVRLEITESAIAEPESGVLEVLRGLRALGLELSVDDFGTGHSSLARLHTFPVSSLKIDRSFVSPLGTGPLGTGPLGARADDGPNRSRLLVVSSIVALAHSLGHTVVAEGVETREQFALLREAGCEVAQGFWMARPLEASEAEELLRSGQRW